MDKASIDSPQAARLKDLQDPQYRAAAIAQRKVFVRQQLHDLPYWMPISGQDLDGLAGLLAGHAVEAEEMHLSTWDLRESEQVRRQQQSLESLQQRQVSEIASLLGNQRFGEWSSYREATGARHYLSEMNERLPAADLLAPEQMRPIAMEMTRAERSMDEETRRLMASGGPQMDPSAGMALAQRLVELSRKQNERVRAAAAQHLSAKQMAVLDAIIRNREVDLEASLAMAGAQLEAQP
jgi:hypothetical protein